MRLRAAPAALRAMARMSMISATSPCAARNACSAASAGRWKRWNSRSPPSSALASCLSALSTAAPSEPTPAVTATPSARQAISTRKPRMPPRNSRRARAKARVIAAPRRGAPAPFPYSRRRRCGRRPASRCGRRPHRRRREYGNGAGAPRRGAAMTLAFALARRELRGGIRGFRVLIACLALGVAVTAGVGSLGAAVDNALKHDAKALLGGDLEFHLFHRPADAAEHAFLAAQGEVAEIIDMRAMARSAAGASRSLIQLKAVDSAYPLYGAVTLDPPQALGAALAFRDGQWGAVAEAALLQRLGAKPGDTIHIGDADFVLRAVLTHEPDALAGGIDFGPKVTIAMPALAATGLAQPGSLVGYGYRVKLPAGIDAGAVAAQARTALPDAGWRIRAFADAAPSLQTLLDRLTVFMTLVGLTALLVGGVGIGNAIRAHLADKLPAIATLKCLGASRRTVFWAYLLQILALALCGIALGLALGALAPFAAAPLLPAALPVAPELGLYAKPLLLATAEGVLVTLVFALWPLGTALEVKPAALFRGLIEPPAQPPLAGIWLAIGAAALALAALAIFSAADRRTALWFVAGAAGALVAFRLLAMGLIAVARRLHPRRPALRLALANLHRPGAPTAGVVASLGLGLAVLVAIVLVHADIAATVDETLPARAPSFFFIDIQPDQLADFDRLLAGMPGVEEIARVPSLRGRITALNGTPGM